MPWLPPPDTAGLIFDCDGTLADTMPVHFLAWTALLTQYDIVFTEKRFYELGGMPTARIVRLLGEECGVVVTDVDAMVVRKESTFLTLLHTIQPINPVVEIAATYRGILPMAVASGGYRRVVEKTLAQIGVADWFDTTVCAEDTVRHKPDPDVFLEAARRLGVDAERCVVFEDTDIGLEAARRAGATPVDVRPWYDVDDEITVR